jgi:type I restriction enzyme R subunit
VASQRRPDIVLYLNGIAIAVIELKRSSVELADGVRQLITNQEEIFNKGFFSTVQLVLAGSDSQGLRYGTTGTPEQFFVEWKDEARLAAVTHRRRGAARPAAGAAVPQGAAARPDPQLHHLRRRHQEGAAPASVLRREGGAGAHRQREGGVIWHTQGSGKSILMVLIAKWLLEHDPRPASWSSPTATSWTSRSSG